VLLACLLQVLVMHGACDPICEAADAANLAAHIAGSELLEVEGADHWYKGRQQQLLDAVTAFALRAARTKGMCSFDGC
jgi:pimeloyl-ACP methyl ester carboxylesterase